MDGKGRNLLVLNFMISATMWKGRTEREEGRPEEETGEDSSGPPGPSTLSDLVWPKKESLVGMMGAGERGGSSHEGDNYNQRRGLQSKARTMWGEMIHISLQAYP